MKREREEGGGTKQGRQVNALTPELTSALNSFFLSQISRAPRGTYNIALLGYVSVTHE